jgi:hypothetical protein
MCRHLVLDFDGNVDSPVRREERSIGVGACTPHNAREDDRAKVATKRSIELDFSSIVGVN